MLSSQLQNLHDRALMAATNYKRAHAELLAIVIEVEKARLFEAFGLKGTYLYCREKLNLSEDVAYSFLAVARKCLEVPELKKAVDAGLDFSKAKQVARVITPSNEADLLSFAAKNSCRDLEREIVKDHPREAVVERIRPVADDRHKLELGLSEALLAQFRRAQDLVSGAERKAASLEETLAAVLKVYLEKKDPQEKAQRAKPLRAAADLHAERIPAASLHAVHLRDKGRCQKPGCRDTRWMDVHHIQERAKGGSHAPENLITLCSYHHREHHRQNPPRGGNPKPYAGAFARKVSAI